MGISKFINKSYLNVNFSDFLQQQDPDNNGFTKTEFKNAIFAITNRFAKNIVKLTAFDKIMFKELNTDKNDVVSYEELANYIKKEYKLNFYAFKNMTINEICTALDNADKIKEQPSNVDNSTNKLIYIM